ncbi:PREDICTED: uncharacterized protein LOC109335460 [Lupinus angustifolius]|uniref:uncharacterized protein LOC109335460 n=1 Tax=Lupinus angustifolius TaxID=3871 RepID=UPI00092F83DB|nr:PREDICTED: uncharacterized protein LOC109335460 [Lupinus angustifolius]
MDTTSITALLKSTQRNWSNQVRQVLTTSIIHTINFIWFCRNQARFKDKPLTFHSALSKLKSTISMSGNTSTKYAYNNMHDFSLLRDLHIKINFKAGPRILEVIWKPSSPGRIKLNTDGASKGNPDHSGGGGIFRDQNGIVMACFACYNGLENALFAE